MAPSPMSNLRPVPTKKSDPTLLDSPAAPAQVPTQAALRPVTKKTDSEAALEPPAAVTALSEADASALCSVSYAPSCTLLFTSARAHQIDAS